MKKHIINKKSVIKGKLIQICNNIPEENEIVLLMDGKEKIIGAPNLLKSVLGRDVKMMEFSCYDVDEDIDVEITVVLTLEDI